MSNNKTGDKQIFEAQDSQYRYPYHHIPYFNNENSAVRIRSLDWGFDYLACIFHAKEVILESNPSSVLDVGCGDGAALGYLQNTNIDKLVGIDLSEKAINFARAFNPSIEFYIRDASEMSEKFDSVLAIEVLEHIPDKDVNKFLQALAERTNPGGLIYISVPSINLPLYKKHYRHYSPEILKQQIESSSIDIEINDIRYFRSPVLFENTYKRLTTNRYWVGEVHAIRKFIWKNIIKSLHSADSNTAQHVIAILKKK